MSEKKEEFAAVLGKHLGGNWRVSLKGTMPIISVGDATGTTFHYLAVNDRSDVAEIWHFQSDTELFVLNFGGQEARGASFDDCVIRLRASSIYFTLTHDQSASRIYVSTLPNGCFAATVVFVERKVDEIDIRHKNFCTSDIETLKTKLSEWAGEVSGGKWKVQQQGRDLTTSGVEK